MVDLKVRAGDREGDTVEGGGKTGYIATFVDKTTKYLAARVMPDKPARTPNRAVVRAFADLPEEPVKTLTMDSGKEFAAHKAPGERLGCPVYFAHPCHCRERGLNEYTNGPVRQYLPRVRVLIS
jgi:IS30 family transposase